MFSEAQLLNRVIRQCLEYSGRSRLILGKLVVSGVFIRYRSLFIHLYLHKLYSIDDLSLDVTQVIDAAFFSNLNFSTLTSSLMS